MIGVSEFWFDADDTLWGEQEVLQGLEVQISELVKERCQVFDFQKKFISTEEANIPIIGYGFSSYTFSMGEALTSCGVDGDVKDEALEMLRDATYRLYHQGAPILQGVAQVLEELKSKGRSLRLVTRGLEWEQRRKLKVSGLAGYFDSVDVVQSKTPDMYRSIAEREDVSSSAVCMVGNSIRSDILPALNCGMHAVWVPCETQWSHDIEVADEHERMLSLSNMEELLNHI